MESSLADDDGAATAERRWPVRFTGSGSEYFRVWIVNLLLILLTATLYYPWARARKLRYFYGHTRVAGHALDFHGDPLRMLGGYLMVGALIALCGLAAAAWPAAGWLLLAIALPPSAMLLRRSLRYRLSHTSWRGQRFAFDGSIAGACQALLPVMVAALLAGMVLAGVADSVVPADPSAPTGVPGIVLLAMALGALACVPWMWWALRRYRHDHQRYAGEGTRLRASAAPVYAAYALTLAVALVAAALLGMSSAIAGVAGVGPWGYELNGSSMLPALLALYALAVVVVQPYLAARLQNLAWSRTEGRQLRFESTLRCAPLVRLTLKNWLLMLLTLGLYWPFAAIALARARLQAVTVIADRRFDVQVADRRAGAPVVAARVSRAKPARRPDSVVVRVQRSWRASLLALATLALVGGAGYEWGVPLLARAVVALLPPSIDRQVGDVALQGMRGHWLQPSRRPVAEQQRLRAAVADMLARAGTDPGLKVELHFHGSRIGPNAFALPGGNVVLTDELIELAAGHDDLLLGVVAHEIGHVRHRHGMRMLVQLTLLGSMGGIAIGDFSSVLATVPALLGQMGYSRDAEREADAESARLMRAAGLSPGAMIVFLERVAAWRAGHAGHAGEADLGVTFSTHPPDAERIRFFRDAAARR